MLVACTAPTPDAPTPVEAAPVVVASAPVKADEPKPTPTVEPPVPIEPIAVPPAPGESVVSWWCVCYARIAAVEAEEVTACRATEAECHALERAVRQGNRGMVARSLSRPCLELKAAHPGDVHGGRSLWSPSKKPGSWLSVGVCRLPGQGELIQNDTSFKVMEDERLGELSVSSTSDEVAQKLGPPTRKGRIEMSEASGDDIQSWFYPAQGLTVAMAIDDRETGKGSVSTLTIKAPATFKTRLGIGIGSTRKEVLDAYGKLRDPEFPSGDKEEVFLAGSIYGGVFFTFKRDKVSQIFVGAGAE